MSLKKITRSISRRLLGRKDEEEKQEVDADTRKILRESLKKALYETTEVPEVPEPCKPITVTEDETSCHVNFGSKAAPGRVERTTDYYTKDGKLIQ